MKVRINISLDEETDRRLRELASDSHTTISQWITDRVWEKDKSEEKEEFEESVGR